MKKRVIIASALLVLLTGCGNTNEDKPKTEVQTTVVTTEAPTTEEVTTEAPEPTTEPQTVTEEPTTTVAVVEEYDLPKLFQVGYNKPLTEEYINALKTGVCEISGVHCDFGKLLYRLKGGMELTYTQAIEHDMSEFSNVSKSDLFADILCISTDYSDVAKDFVKVLATNYVTKGISLEELNRISTDKNFITERIMKAMVSEESDDLALARENFQKLILDGQLKLSYRELDFNHNHYGEYDFWAVRSDLGKLDEISEEDRINFLADVMIMMTVASNNNQQITQQLFTEFLSDLANKGVVSANDLESIKNGITSEKLEERIENATR